MNKEDLVNLVTKKCGTTKKLSADMVGTVVEGIFSTLAKGDTVQLIGFGTFKVTDRKARKGRNPQTGEEIDIPAAKVVKFTAGKALKDSVNKGGKKKKK